MVFNSFEFLVFFTIVFFIYYTIKPAYRWSVIILSSSVFLVYHVPSFMLVLAPVILFNYITGLVIESSDSERRKKTIFIASILVNISILVFFKYINFILENTGFLVHQINPELNFKLISIILPLGVSFYIFQAIGYNIDIYWETSKAERHLGYFAVYMMFFPKLISGPIERTTTFLPQIQNPVYFDSKKITAGLQLILWGLFKKLVIADRIEPSTSLIFNNVNDYHGLSLFIGVGLYVVQIYCDFSGYTDIALGLARTLGYNLTDNFNRPFSATSISDFWRRWHISLSSWVTDYIYKPVSANKRHWGKYGTIYALILTFVTLGFWHGASWNFVIYGFLHSLAVTYEFLTTKLRKHLCQMIPRLLYNSISRILTISYLGFTMLFFRYATLTEALTAIKNMVNNFKLSIHGLGLGLGVKDVIIVVLGIIIVEIVEKAKAKKGDFESVLVQKPLWVRYSIYYFFIFSIMLFGSFGVSEFIYFKF